MDERLRIRIKQFNEIKYGTDKNEILLRIYQHKKMNVICFTRMEHMNVITCLVAKLRLQLINL